MMCHRRSVNSAALNLFKGEQWLIFPYDGLHAQRVPEFILPVQAELPVVVAYLQQQPLHMAGQFCRLGPGSCSCMIGQQLDG